MVSFRDYLLLERIVGNTGWVYHRTIDNPEESDIVKYGIKPTTNQSAMYGRGLYCCYDLEDQLRPDMANYGDYILKGKIDLNNFAILDEDIFELANPRGNFEEHLKKIGTNIDDINEDFPYTSGIAKHVWAYCKRKGYNGIIFTGRKDGKVAVVWNRKNFIPYQYTEDDGVNWIKLSPDIKSIKRAYDPEYDKDDEVINYFKVLKELSNKEEIGNLSLPSTYEKTIFLKNVKKIGNISAVNATELDLPQLLKSGNIDAENAIEINLPQLRESGKIGVSSAKKINFPQLQKSATIYAHNAVEINLPQLQEIGHLGYIFADKATLINIPQLKEGRTLIANNAKKIIIPKHLKDILSRIPSDCEIIHPEDAPQIKVNENVTFKKYLMLKECLVGQRIIRGERK